MSYETEQEIDNYYQFTFIRFVMRFRPHSKDLIYFSDDSQMWASSNETNLAIIQAFPELRRIFFNNVRRNGTKTDKTKGHPFRRYKRSKLLHGKNYPPYTTIVPSGKTSEDRWIHHDGKYHKNNIFKP